MNQISRQALRLPQSPLVFVVSQIQITPVLSMAEKIPAMQESFRKNGFPRLSVREIETTRVSNGKTKVELREQWEFSDRENFASVVVDTDFIVYQVTKYELFETFVEAFDKILKVFELHAEPGLVERIGLRYVDLVKPQAGKTLESYFSENLRGFKVQSLDSREGFISESMSIVGGKTQFKHRYIEAARGFGFPPDLMPITLKIDRELRMQENFGMLDMDHFICLNEEFSVERILSNLWMLHEYQTKAFQASVTEEALREWGERII